MCVLVFVFCSFLARGPCLACFIPFNVRAPFPSSLVHHTLSVLCVWAFQDDAQRFFRGTKLFGPSVIESCECRELEVFQECCHWTAALVLLDPCQSLTLHSLVSLWDCIVRFLCALGFRFVRWPGEFSCSLGRATLYIHSSTGPLDPAAG